MGGAFEPVECFLVAAFVAVGVDHGDQVQGDLLQLGRIEPFGVVEQDLDSAGAQGPVAGEPVDGTFDDVGLGGGEPPVTHRFGDRRQREVG